MGGVTGTSAIAPCSSSPGRQTNVAGPQESCFAAAPPANKSAKPPDKTAITRANVMVHLLETRRCLPPGFFRTVQAFDAGNWRTATIFQGRSGVESGEPMVRLY